MGKQRLSIIPAAALADARVNYTMLKVLGQLGTYTDDNGWCFPRQNEIGRVLDLGRPAVNRAVQRLAECGYIEIHHRYRKDGGKAANWYRVVLDPALPPTEDELENEPPHVSPEIHTPCAGGDTCHVSPADTSDVSPSDTSITTHLNDPSFSEDVRACSDTSMPKSLNALRVVLDGLRTGVGDATWASWIKPLVVVSLDPPIIGAPSRFHAKQVRDRFLLGIEELLGMGKIEIRVSQAHAVRGDSGQRAGKAAR